MLARWSWLLHRSTIYKIPPSVDVRVVKRPGAPLYQGRFFALRVASRAIAGVG